LASQSAFRTANGWLVEEKSQMCCQTKAAGMSDALAIDQKCVRLSFESFNGLNANRRFAKRKQARDIWESQFLSGTCCLDNLETRRFRRSPKALFRTFDPQNNNGSKNLLTILAESTIQTCDQLRRFLYCGKLYFAGEALLQFYSL